MKRLCYGIAMVLLSLGPGCDDEEPAATDLAADVQDAARPDAPRPDLSPDVTPDVTPDKPLAPDTGHLWLRAGAASVDITPTAKGVPLAGYGGAPRRDLTNLATIPARVAAALGACYDPTPGTVASLFAPNQGKHDPITARTLVLANGKTKAAIIKVDTIGVSRRFRDDVEAAAKTLGIPKENLILAATHTHGGPGAVSDQKIWELIAADCFHKATYTAMLQGVVKSLKTAHANLTPAEVGISAGTETTVTKNRMIEGGKVDPQLGLIKVVDYYTGKPIAALLNFAIHGTCLGASNMKFTADVMGYIEGAVEKKLGGGVAIFTNGAEGDVAPDGGGFTGAAKIGAVLGEATAKLWKKTPTKKWIEIAGAYGDVKFPSPTLNGCLPLFGSKTTICDLLPNVKIPLSMFMQSKLPFGAIRLDDVVLSTIPGEAITDVGLAVKAEGKKKGFRHTFVIGLANDFMGYVVTEKYYNLGEYESQATMYGKNTGTHVIQACEKYLKLVQPSAVKPFDGGGLPVEGGTAPNDASVDKAKAGDAGVKG